ncbi:hypothetical protein ACU81Q_14605 [Komagataeibacter melomenusus]
MTETKTETELYVVPGRLTDEEETNMRSKLLGGPILGPADMFARMVGIVGTPIQPCADVETVGWVDPDILAIVRKNKGLSGMTLANMQATSRTVPLVRRTDMEAQVAVRDMEIDRLRTLFEKMADILTSGRVDMRSLMACRKYVAAGLGEGATR